MGGDFGASPDELRGVAGDLGEVSAAMKAVVSSLVEKLAGEGQPWGDNAMGEQFAQGSGGYVAQLGWVQGSVSAKTGLLDQYAQVLKQAADSFQQSDQG